MAPALFVVRGARLLAAILIVSFLPLPASAGDQTSPEITDPAGDGAASGKDIVAVWVSPGEDEKSVDVTFESGAAIAAEYPSFHAVQVRFTLWFKPTTGLPAGKSVAYVTARVANGQTAPSTLSPSAYFGTTTTAGTFDNLNNEVGLVAPKITGKQIVINVPLSNLKGFTIGTDAWKEMYANVVLVLKGPVAVAGGPDVNTIRETYDRAPNTGFGQDFAGGSGAGGAVDFSFAPVDNQTMMPGGTAIVPITLINNGSATNVTLSANSSSAAVNVSFDQTTVDLDEAGNATLNLTIEADANATDEATIEITAVSGDFNQTITFSVTITPAATTGAPTNSTAATNETGAANEADGGIPSLPLLGVVAAIGVAAVLRVRRRAD